MDSEGTNLLNSTVLIATLVGGCVLLFFYILKQLNADQKIQNNEPSNEKVSEHVEKKKESGTTTKSKKKGTEGRWTGRSDKQTFSHPWLLTSLKGHTAQVLDMDFASNGKYLASCAEEEPDPGGDDLRCDGSNSSANNSDSNQENSQPSSATPSPRAKGLSRRQRKNRRRDDHSPPDSKKKPKPKKPAEPTNRKPINTPLKQFSKLRIPEWQLALFLRSYLLSPEQMLSLGYPMESGFHPGCAIIFKSPMGGGGCSGGGLSGNSTQNYRHNRINVTETRFDVNAQEFVPGMDYSEIKAEWNANHDSGQGSGGSSISGENPDDSEESSLSDLMQQASDSDGSQEDLSNDQDPTPNLYESSNEHKCVRCGKAFFISNTGEYITQETCLYHWGKLQTVFVTSSKHNGTICTTEYSCCKGRADTRGCTTGRLHVWNGLAVGLNGPLHSYVRTRVRRNTPLDGNYGVYALDCEMCFTVKGLELTKVTVVGADGHLVYDSYVKPEHEVIDYNTRFSGITAKDLNKKSTKTLREVQNDLMGFISAHTILIGHGLENDLRALRIMHNSVVDTAVTFPHYNGLPFRRSLKSLTTYFLKRDIQCSANGHNSYEDASACMELMLWKVRRDFLTLLEHCYQ